jgi:hypothetical protein
VKKITTFAGLLLMTTASLFAAQTTTLVGTEAELIASGGSVVVYFAGESAGFDSVLSLISPINVGPFFPNHSTPIGTALDLGTFDAGDVLRFRMDVLSTGQSFFTGPASGNPDNVIHVGHAIWAADATIPVNGVLVGFEDVLGGGDRDYNDNTFVFTNVRSETVVPEPSAIILTAAGLTGLVLIRRRK